MEFYVYCSQDLMILNYSQKLLKSGNIYNISFGQNEEVLIYGLNGGVIVVNQEMLTNKSHNQLNYYDLSDKAILCEIKPFIYQDNIKQYAIKGSYVKLIKNMAYTYIFFIENS